MEYFRSEALNGSYTIENMEMEEIKVKATGVIRRLDDLGRIVIPKEIRRTFRIREGDPMEIFTNREGQIILKKYSPIGDLGDFALQYAEALSKNTGHVVCILDKDQVIAVAGGNRKELMNQPISRDMEEIIEERNVLVVDSRQGEAMGIAIRNADFKKEVIAPIVCQGDAIGAVIILAKDEDRENVEVQKALASTAADFLGKQMEL